MKVSYNWLKTFVDVDIRGDDLAEALSLLGFEVDDVEKRGLDYPGVVVGKVVSRGKHPNADKLSVCEVDIGADGNLKIVCGAPNVAAGQTVAVATVGSVLPGDFKIRKAKIRGEHSFGMICSEAELGISDEADGIWVLPDDLPLGKQVGEALKVESDEVLDVFITPNRPDAMSMIGIAREVATLNDSELRIPPAEIVESGAPISDAAAVEVKCPVGCPRFTARLIRGVKIGPSPDWMVERLAAAGVRSINNVVDVTNYVLMETGQPLHSYDYDLLAGGKIVVREAKEGDLFTTLDGKERKMQAGTVMIYDGEKAVGIGGIMGGLNTEVHDGTVNVLLEAANFNPASIRKGMRHLSMHTEACARFARGVDPNGAMHAQDRATQLIAELAGGEVAKGAIDIYPQKIEPKLLELKVDRINGLLGTSLSATEMFELMAKVGFKERDGKVEVPTFRPDVERTADLAEEVGRLYGFDNIEMPEFTAVPYDTGHNPYDDFQTRLRSILTDGGLQEVVTTSMIHVETWEKLTAAEIYPIMNPITADMNGMRNSLVPSLLTVLQYNLNRQIRDLAIFEINRIFHHPGDLVTAPKEDLTLTLALTGNRQGRLWHSNNEPFDFYDIKGAVEHLSDKISLDKPAFIAYDNFAVDGQSAEVSIGRNKVGYIGRVSDKLLKHFDIEYPVYVAELNVGQLFGLQKGDITYQVVPRYPKVERDLAVVVDRQQEVGGLIEAIKKIGGKNLRSVSIFDIYAGKQIDNSKKSVAFRLLFQSRDKTLTEQEVSAAVAGVLKTLEKDFGAELRS